MKKGWKVALISLGSLLGLVVIVVAVALWLVFTPARLTSIVNKLSGQFIQCENHFERVDLTLFKTWPNVGLDVKNVVLVNPYEPAADNPLAAEAVHSDTLARIGSLVVGLDLKAFLDSGGIIVRQVRIDDAVANLYTAPDGWSNLDIFPKSTDTTESESSLPECIQVEKIAINNLSAQYCNLPQRMLASAQGLDVTLKGEWLDKHLDADLVMDLDSVRVDMRDSLYNKNIYADLGNLSLKVEGRGPLSGLQGRADLALAQGDIMAGGRCFTTEAMQASHHDLLKLKLPFQANLDSLSFHLDDAAVSLLNYDIALSGDVALASDEQPMSVDAAFGFDDWQVAELLAVLPPFVTQGLKGMDIDARLNVDGTAKGVVAEGQLPLINASARLSKGSFSAPRMLPVDIKKIEADLTADLNLSTAPGCKGDSRVVINSFSAAAKKSRLSVTGHVDDLLGDDMLIDARVKGDVSLPDIQMFLPDTMPLVLNGTTVMDVKVKSRLSQLAAVNLEKMQADGTLRIKQLDVRYDSLHASSPELAVKLRLPKSAAELKQGAKAKFKELIDARVTAGQLNVEMPASGLEAQVYDPDIHVGMPNILDKRQSLAAAFDISFSRVNADLDSITVYSDSLALVGSVRNDTTAGAGLEGAAKALKQWNPDIDIDLHRGVFAKSDMSEALRMPSFRFNYTPEVCQIQEADILWGVSDYHLTGRVLNVEDWLSHKAMLRGTLDFKSQYADIDQLMSILSGMGSDKDTLEQQRIEDNVPKEANPFIVPKDVKVKLNTDITRCVVFGNDLDRLGGSVTINDGVAILEQIGFTCKAARMQLTGLYKSPRVNNLFVGLDFHLLDIQIEDLLDMIPAIDTLVPMLSAFKGKANFHLAAETSLDAFYKPKMSTLLGAAAISGEDLVVLDNEKIATIAKLLQLKDWRNKDNNLGIDSLSVEATVFRKEVEIYPFLLNLNKYRLCLNGLHTLDNNCAYHAELLKSPFLLLRLAVDVKGNLSKPKIELGEVRYADLYKPEKQDALEKRTLALKQLVRQALESNVKE